MKYLLSLIICPLLFQTTNPAEWACFIGESRIDHARKILKLKNSYYIFGGNTKYSNSFNDKKEDIFVYKTDLQGKVLWTKEFFCNENLAVCDALFNETGGITINAERYMKKRETALVMNMDTMGNILLAEPFDEDNNEIEPYSIEKTTQNGKLVVGFTKISNPVSGGFFTALNEQMHMYALKLNKKNQKEFAIAYTIAGTNRALATNIAKTNATDYIITGEYEIDKNKHPVFFKINEKGKILWSKTFDNLNISVAQIKPLSNGNVIIMGHLNNSTNIIAEKLPIVICINQAGAVIWANSYGSTGFCSNVFGINEHNMQLIINGVASQSFNKNQYQQYALLLNATNGTLIWSQIYGGSSSGVYKSSNCIIANNSFVYCGVKWMPANITISEGLILGNTQETFLMNKSLDYMGLNNNNSMNLTTTALNLQSTNQAITPIPLTNKAYSGVFTIADIKTRTIDLKRHEYKN